MRQRKSKFAKRTWNVPWNQQFRFLISHFTMSDLGARLGWLLPDGKPCGGGANEADVGNKGLKRTGNGISLAFNGIAPIGANELRGVKSFVMCGISGNFQETFIPAYSGLTSTSRAI